MPLKFTNHTDEGYLEVTYVHPVTDEVFLKDWETFLESDEWIPLPVVFSNLTEAGTSSVTGDTLITHFEYASRKYRERGISTVTDVIFAPKDLQYGIARMFKAYSKKSPETVQIFRDRDKAIQWLKENK